MASGRTLIALAVTAIALAGWLGVDLGRGDSASPDRRLVPEASESPVVRVAIVRDGAAPVELVRRDRELAIATPLALPMAEAAAAELDATFIQLSYRRHVADRVNQPTRAQVRLTLASGATIELDVGDEIESTGQAWMSRRGWRGSYLVVGYSARVLSRGIEELRTRRIVQIDPAKAAQIAISAGARSIKVTGDGVDIGEAGWVRMDPAARADLMRALRRLEFSAFSPVEGPAVLTIELSAADGRREQVEVFGPCDGGRRVRAPTGEGCAEEAEVAELEALAARGRDLWDRRLGLIGASAVRLARGAISVRGDREQDPVRRWLARVDELATGESLPSPPAAATAEASISVTQHAGQTERIDLFRVAGGWAAARAGEAIAFRLGPEADHLLEPSPEQFRSLDILARDPTEVAAIEIAERGRSLGRFERGELLGEWTARAASIELAPGRLDELARALSSLSAVRYARFSGAPSRTITIELDAPPTGGAPARFAIALGARSPDGCHASIDPDPESTQSGSAPLTFIAARDVCDLAVR